MSQQPSGGGHGHPAVDLLSRIVSATDRMRKAREAGQQSEIQAAQQERRQALQEAREFLQRHQAQGT